MLKLSDTCSLIFYFILHRENCLKWWSLLNACPGSTLFDFWRWLNRIRVSWSIIVYSVFLDLFEILLKSDQIVLRLHHCIAQIYQLFYKESFLLTDWFFQIIDFFVNRANYFFGSNCTQPDFCSRWRFFSLHYFLGISSLRVKVAYVLLLLL